MWYPQATGGGEIIRFDSSEIYPKYRIYDRVSFAFHVPEEEIFKTNDLENSLIVSKTLSL